MSHAENAGDTNERQLTLQYNGRIIEHLGLQMYQSPTAAIAELVSNSWDAEAENVHINLPDSISTSSTIVIQDDGMGMTFEECQERYLNVGYCRRGQDANEKSPNKDRPILGRKGIGKFAGFGIAGTIEVDTISKATGERTIFVLNYDALREGTAYIGKGVSLKASWQESAPASRKHGTIITLRDLSLKRTVPQRQFGRSMARRFLLLQWADDFHVYIDGTELPKDDDLVNVEYIFPRDYPEEKRTGISIDDNGWAIESISSGKQVKWKVCFHKTPIDEEELCGISVFANGKLAQKPFFFNLSGGLGGQHGQEYISGSVQADYMDQLKDDVIATERQRVNWEHAELIPLETWGQNRVKQLLRIWRDLRGRKRRDALEAKVANFSQRLGKLPSHERRTVKQALNKVASIPALSDTDFESIGEGMLTAWENGRLHDIIDNLATQDDLNSNDFLSILAEADVLTALNAAEAIRAKLEAIRGLEKRIERRELENAVRDYIADRPYLLHPRWETYKVEKSLAHILEESANEAGLNIPPDSDDPAERKRIDLALRSDNNLLIVEFMRPGKTADWEHFSKIRLYMNLVREKVANQSALGIDERRITGLVVADKLDQKPQVSREIPELEKSNIFVFNWKGLLEEARRTWREFLEIVGDRAPDDERVKKLRNIDSL